VTMGRRGGVLGATTCTEIPTVGASTEPAAAAAAAAAAAPETTEQQQPHQMPSAADDRRTIEVSLQNAPHLSLSHSFFLSHVQRESGDFARVFSLLLHSEADLPCWLDQAESRLTAKTMVRGIAQSAVFMVLLTKSYFESRWCRLELRTARYLKKPIIMIHETDERVSGFARFEDYFKSAPTDLVGMIEEVTSRPLRRKGYEQEALVQDLFKEVHLDLKKAEAAKQPLQILQAEAVQTLRCLGETAACYVDLGSGQTMVYLLAVAEDASLEYQHVHEIRECFLHMDKDQRDKARVSTVASFMSIRERLAAINTPIESLFHVCIGATAEYRRMQESGPEGAAQVDEVEKWFRSVIAEANIIDSTRVTFQTLVARDEAMFEWLAVKTALKEQFDKKCDVVLSGGNGSVQVSMENDFSSSPSNLKEATAMVEKEGVAAYRASVRATFKAIFGQIQERLDLTPRSRERPMNVVLISSFYYAAVASRVTSRSDYPRYRNLSDLLEPAQRLLDEYTASPATSNSKNAANVSRMIELIDLVTKHNSNNVEILIVREWTVRNKDYKATWTTGKFLHDLRLKVLEQVRAQRSMSSTPVPQE